MLLWFAGVGFVCVWAVFRDTAIDYRLVVAGVLLPDVVDAGAGRAWLLHTLAFSVGLLLAVMAATGGRGRRGRRRRVLALPIGTFLHLVLDGVWTRTELLWWPAFGWSLPGVGLPSLSRPLPVVAVQEVLGLLALIWAWRRFRLGEPARRSLLWRTGRLGRDLGPGPVHGPPSRRS